MDKNPIHEQKLTILTRGFSETKRYTIRTVNVRVKFSVVCNESVKKS